jgi:hypothetical protein
LERKKNDFGKFACPTCNATCALPGCDLDNLLNFTATGADVATGGENAESISVDECSTASVIAGGKDETRDLDTLTVVDVKCQICHHHRKDVQAATLCPECDQLHLCKECTVIHAKNKATGDHVVVQLKTPATDGVAICVMHNAPLTKYCSNCKTPACKICVMLDHGDHEVEKLSDTILRRVEAVKVTFQQREDEVKKLQCLTKKLVALKKVAPKLDKQEALLKEIEDHAQICMDEIVTWKENMKDQVKNEFKIIRDIPEAYETATNILKKLEKPLSKAAKLLSETTQHPSYLDRLTSIQHDLEKCPQLVGDTDGEKYRNFLQELYQRNFVFRPCALPLAIGKIDIKEDVNKGKLDPKSIFSHTIEVHAQDTFIPCVANLGEKFAIAHPTTGGQPSDAMHIYEFPDKFSCTLKDHVNPLYDMSSTPDGKLAVLSDGTDGTSCSIKVFDPDTGHIISTHNLDIPKPMSLGVDPQNQRFVLSDMGDGKRQITSIEEGGDRMFDHVIDMTPMLRNPCRISCGWQYIFVMGENGVAKYQLQENGLSLVSLISKYINLETDTPKDIAASIWDYLLVADLTHLDNVYLLNYSQEHNVESVCEKKIFSNLSGTDKECRISTSGCHIVLSRGQTFTVFEY